MLSLFVKTTIVMCSLGHEKENGFAVEERLKRFRTRVAFNIVEDFYDSGTSFLLIVRVILLGLSVLNKMPRSVRF